MTCICVVGGGVYKLTYLGTLMHCWIVKDSKCLSAGYCHQLPAKFDLKKPSPVAAATVACLVKYDSKGLWVAGTWRGTTGQWVSA